MGNPSPVLMIRGATVTNAARIVGKDGLKLEFQQANDRITALGWGMGYRRDEIREGESYDVAFRIERDDYRGIPRLQARLIDFRRCLT
jgi:single-stranded-DNA-specific exonuclease